MKSDIKQLWIDALLSGEYAQGYRRLRNMYDDGGEPTYCCLGVLTDLAVKAGILEWDETVCECGAHDNASGQQAYLSDKVRVWAGLEESNPELGTYDTAAYVNDNGYSFENIAGLIDRYL